MRRFVPLALLIALAPGCSKEGGSVSPAAPSEELITEEEAAQEAAQDIDAGNADDELDALEQEIEGDE